MKSLLVEDNPADARLIREVLTEASDGAFQVEHFGRLTPALARLRQEAFDVVLLDLDLPRFLDVIHSFEQFWLAVVTLPPKETRR